MNIRQKAVLVLLILTVVPILLTVSVIFYMNGANYDSQQKSETLTKLRNLSAGVNTNFSKVEMLSNSFLFQNTQEGDTILSIYRQEDNAAEVSDAQWLKNDRAISQVVDSMTDTNDYLEGIYLFTDRTIHYETKHMNYYLDDSARESAWYRQAIQNHGNLSVSLPDGVAPSKQNYLVFAREVIDPDTLKTLGVMLVLCNADLFQSIYDAQNPGSEIRILDNAGLIIYDSRKGTLKDGADASQLALIRNRKSGYLYDRQRENYVAFARLRYSDWSLIVRQSSQSYRNTLYRSLLFSLLIVVSCSLLSVGISALFSHMFTIPVIRLSNLMQDGNIESLHVDAKMLRRQDEIGTLYRRFQSMVQEINNLIQEKYKNRIILLDSRLKALSSQIDSHFVFNTLESINSLAAIEHNSTIQVMVRSLGGILRYAIDLRTDFVSLSDEVRQIESYVGIQSVRLGRKIEIRYDLQERAAEEKVPKFILQPIVENSIVHGFLGLESPWIITLEASCSDGLLRLCLRDNGRGMEDGELISLRKSLHSGEVLPAGGESCGIGLSNINQRVKLLYGLQYGLDINSVKGAGTEVFLLVPRQREKE